MPKDKNYSPDSEQLHPGYAHDASSPITGGTQYAPIGNAKFNGPHDILTFVQSYNVATRRVTLTCGHTIDYYPGDDDAIKPGYVFPCSVCKFGVQQEQRKAQAAAQIKQFESGAKSSGNLPPYECLTLTFLRRAAMRMKLGMHYGKHNWKKGARDKTFILERLNHAMEHLAKAMYQIDNDTPMADDDLAAVVVNCMFAMEYQEPLIPYTPPQTPQFIGGSQDNSAAGTLDPRD